MRLELISLVLVLAIAGGLVIGGGISGGFFTSVFSGSPVDSQVPADEAAKPDTSGFGVKMKTTGSKTAESPAQSDEEADEPEETASPPITGLTGGGGGKGGGTASGETTNHSPVIEEIADIEAEEGTTIEFKINVEDADGDDVDVSIVSGPGIISAGNTYTYEVSCKEESGDKIEDVLIEATDGKGGRAEVSFSIKIVDNRAYISIGPATKEVSPGETFYVDVSIDTEEPVLTVAFGIEYDNDIINFTNKEGDVTNGGFLYTESFGGDSFAFFGYEDSVKVYIVTGTREGVSGSGTLVHVYFTSLDEIDQSRLDFEFADIGDEEGKKLCVSTSGGVVNVVQ